MVKEVKISKIDRWNMCCFPARCGQQCAVRFLSVHEFISHSCFALWVYIYVCVCMFALAGLAVANLGVICGTPEHLGVEEGM